MKLLILLAILYIIYRYLKSWMASRVQTPIGKDVQSVDDVMVKDPFCGVYFPKREGVHLKLNGEEIYFCSTECKDKFLASHSVK